MATRRTFVETFFGSLSGSVLLADDWPQWRGPKRDGNTQSAGRWSQNLRSIWKTAVGEGHASPVVAGKSVFQFARQGDREVVLAFDLESGKKLWEYGYAAPYEMNPAAESHGRGPKSTPAVSGGQVYSLGMTGVVSCLDAAGGKLAWKYESRGKFKQTSPLYGVAASPLVDTGQLIVYMGTDTDGALTSMDTRTGSIKWQWKGDGPGYASPVIAGTGGSRQLIAFSAENLVGVAPADGKLLWKIPFRSPYSQNAVTPLVLGDTVIYSGLSNPVTAIRIPNSGQPAKLWDNPALGMYMSSPVFSGGLVFGLTNRNKGQFFALDPKNGKTVWTSEGRQGDNASLVAIGETVLALTTEGELHVFRASQKGLEPIRKQTVAQSPTWAHPAVAGNRVLVKDRDSLAMWSAD